MLNTEITQALLRCQYMEETVFTLNANRMTERWLSDGHKRCDQPRGWGTRTVPQGEDNEVDNTNQGRSGDVLIYAKPSEREITNPATHSPWKLTKNSPFTSPLPESG